MLAVYVKMIHKGLIGIDDVPTANGNRDKVKAALEIAGWTKTEVLCNKRSEYGALFLCLLEHLVFQY